MDAVIATLGGPNGIWWLAGAYFSMVFGERAYYALAGRRDYNDADAWCSIGLNLMSSLIGMGVGILLPIAAYVFAFENLRLMTLESTALAVLAAFVIHELIYYIDHRLGHRVGLFWAFHSIHHSSNEFNHSTAARGFYLDGLPRVPMEFAAAALFGVPPIVYFAVAGAKNVFGIWNHASYIKGLGWLEAFVATPRNHKIHHANQPHYIDRNYSQVLIIWDRLFGTFAPYTEEPIVGLVKPVHDNNPLTAQFAGFRQLWERMKMAPRWRDRLAYLWRPPEWSHDGVCRSDCPKFAAQAGMAAARA